MLRLLFLALLLVNGIYYGWSQGLLQPYGWSPEQQSEPQRLEQQLKPEALKILTPKEFNLVETQLAADLAPKDCLVVGPLEDGQISAARRVLESGWPANSWQLQPMVVAPRWIVYMGKYANEDQLSKKRSELLAMKLQPEALQNSALEIGMSLGAYPSQAEANAALVRLNQRGVHTAKVVQELQGGNGTQLRLPAVTDALKARLVELRPALGSRTFKTCG